MYGSYLSVLLSLMLGPSPGSIEKLQIVVLEGQGAINNVSRRSARDPVVQVLDEKQRPVPGATVTFLLPRNGPGGSFLDGSSTVTTISDEQGRAVGRGLQPNSTTGAFDIEVRASFEKESASATIHQINAAPAREASTGSSRKFILLGVMAGAVAGVVAATSGGDPRASSAGPGNPSSA